jgi:methyltransferase (TIGR00027 family)
VIEALSNGVRQVVIVGAGYDDRAFRFRTSGVKFFEADHPSTQNDKAQRIRQLKSPTGPVFIALDFRRDRLDEALEQAGHDARSPSLFICEGVLIYLDQTTIIDLLGRLNKRSSRGSSLLTTLATHPAGIDSEKVLTNANAKRRGSEAEPWVTILPLGRHSALLEGAGWRVSEAVDAADLEPDATRGRTILISALPEL